MPLTDSDRKAGIQAGHRERCRVRLLQHSVQIRVLRVALEPALQRIRTQLPSPDLLRSDLFPEA
jgi:hypothetical protein